MAKHLLRRVHPFLLHRALHTKPKIVVGMSGGVDSSVAAYLLKQKNECEVLGLYMNNWDASDEEGQATCPADMDYELVRQVCSEIGIECARVDFVQEYWNNVFEPCLDQYAMGLTPNPDVLCNREIKFDVFAKHSKALGADFIATGHYARLVRQDNGSNALYAAVDANKDQSYFLSHVHGSQFQNVVFPLGELEKPQVRRIAAQANLCTATKKDSVGICFIGKRSFGSFLAQYVPPRVGTFISIVDDKVLHQHEGYSAYTIGQGAKVSGLPTKWFVVGKREEDAAVLIAPGTHHPALFSDEIFVKANAFNWIQGHLPSSLEKGDTFTCLYRARYRQTLGTCRITVVKHSDVIAGTSKHQQDRLNDISKDAQYLKVEFEQPQRGIAPGQSLVLYHDDGMCYGGGAILSAGPSYWERNKPLPEPLCDWST
ncbi:tRNA-specific 2-thiouridylase mnmA [Thraustotheca clavata]|uniref:tRNA-5-taurinomethyluridine 2-sulfurtransferase n=1 Tax=Thraustotheca clavata TaxID=74557 RepID=A0A1W0A7Y9_9STRA|nr:tRNA-specific 2-thiouridylase mnmA [Thraustotheca clavata]